MSSADVKSFASDSSDSVKCLNDFIDIHDRPMRRCNYIAVSKAKSKKPKYIKRSQIRIKDIPIIAESNVFNY